MILLICILILGVVVWVSERNADKRANARSLLQMTTQGAIYRQRQLGLTIARRQPLVWLTQAFCVALASWLIFELLKTI